MASQSDENNQNPATASQPAAEDHQDSKPEATNGSSPTSVFVNSEPIREEQVQNAMKFLSHPKVRGSPVMYRRSFLERKGLTKEEIDEAFRRVPDPTPTVTSTQPVAANEDGKLKPSSTSPPQAALQNMQPASATPSNSMTKMGYLSHFRWTHAVIAVGLLAASGAGTAVLFKKSIIPRLKSWIRKVVMDEEDERDIVKGKPSLAEEAAVAAKAAAAAAADVARTSQEMLASKSEEKRYFEELTSLLNYQVREMKSMTSAVEKLEGQSNTSGRIPITELDDRRISVTQSRQSYLNGKVDGDARSVRSLSPPASVEPSVAPHPKSYMEIMAMVQRGEKPSNIRDINDQPPNPNQPVPDPRVVPKPKPWEVGQIQSNSTNLLQSQGSGDGLNYGYQDNLTNGDSSASWWQRKNARITEIETEGEQNFGSPAAPVQERPIQRSWVPPQPPPVAMAEAAAAIRQPKKPMFQNEQLTDDQLMARSSEITDELQRVTRISESGGAPEANGSSSALQISETSIGEDQVLNS
ncbi:peroxisomal membrane protein PEX14-like isoform X1 [Nicotiana tomentosiformis]|uniref:peroxisomal membrane protein PEX14-like isoform X1 n=1 Tax=Nicotiana tomentosiformis TaxID=4098 RepID=UPI00051C2E58|nr:peroxisomal membrane protein PEX14-like isoform X1 [Nicotiana tomentosiformis]XP_033508290.1 peroxisomal membrane protein PEX14-like isoform X1 [Nicotiana tomentosiformis]